MPSCIMHIHSFSGGADDATNITNNATSVDDMLCLNVAPDITVFVRTKGTLKTVPETRFILLHVLLNHVIKT